MSAALVAAALVVIGVCAEIVAPGNALYHEGWYNVTLAALAVIFGLRAPTMVRALTTSAARIGASVAAIGVLLVAFAGVASGLLGPDARTIVGAPGESVRVEDVGGTLDFPLAQSGDSAPVSLVRGGNAQPISGRRFVGSYLLRTIPRSVVEVEATDTHGAHLTITQPSGAAFLSPVLLMQGHQTLLGFDVPLDSFAIPALHRTVKAVLFPAKEAAQLRSLDAPPGTAAVLFDVETDTGGALPHNISAALDGGSAQVADVVLHARVFTFPAIEIVSVPHVVVVGIGLLCAIGGLVTALSRRRAG